MSRATAYEYNKRWRTKNPRLRHAAKKRNYQLTANAPRTGELWEGWEDRLVLAHVVNDRELSQSTGRSVQAIQLRRSRLTIRALRGELTRGQRSARVGRFRSAAGRRHE